MKRNVLDVAIKYLSDHNCSEQELRIKLEEEFAHLSNKDKHINLAFTRLHELHLLNDARLAESLAQRYSHKGNRFITQTLRQKGVADEVITQILETLPEEYIRALDEVRKKKYHLHSENETKLVRFLSGRKFTQHTIQIVIKQLCVEGYFTLSNDIYSNMLD